RSRIASRALQILCAGLVLVMLSRLGSFFITLRSMELTFSATQWISWISIVAAVMLLMYHYIPNMQPQHPLTLHGIELSGSLLFFVLFVCLTVALIVASSGTSLVPACSPGKFEGRCDALNASIVFLFINTCAWGYSAFRSFSDSRKQGNLQRSCLFSHFLSPYI
ncbi:hypothetical protein HMI54_010783, partial [Coelomomyces lativittatus]